MCILAQSIVRLVATVNYSNKIINYFCFSQGSVNVDSQLIFSNVTATPNVSSVADTLQTAASSSNFSLPVNTSTITATGKSKLVFKC